MRALKRRPDPILLEERGSMGWAAASWVAVFACGVLFGLFLGAL